MCVVLLLVLHCLSDSFLHCDVKHWYRNHCKQYTQTLVNFRKTMNVELPLTSILEFFNCAFQLPMVERYYIVSKCLVEVRLESDSLDSDFRDAIPSLVSRLNKCHKVAVLHTTDAHLELYLVKVQFWNGVLALACGFLIEIAIPRPTLYFQKDCPTTFGLAGDEWALLL